MYPIAPFYSVLFLLAGLAASPLLLAGQDPDLLPGDARLTAERVREHSATHRFVQFPADGDPVEVGRLSRSVERLFHTADEPAILVSMQFRSETRSGLDILYLDAGSLTTLVRYLTAPTGLTTMYQRGGELHVTYSGRDGSRQTADTVLAHPRFGGASDLVLASLELAPGESVVIPEISGAANTLAAALVSNRLTFEGTETLDVPGVWSGPVRRFEETRRDGSTVTYWISADAPHLVRQDFRDASDRLFLRWELVEYAEHPVRYGS